MLNQVQCFQLFLKKKQEVRREKYVKVNLQQFQGTVIHKLLDSETTVKFVK